jgi:hypothetical protein
MRWAGLVITRSFPIGTPFEPKHINASSEIPAKLIFDFRVPSAVESGTVACMVTHTNCISQPGWTGARVLRIVQATPRTFLSVDPIGRRSAAATARSFVRSHWSSMLRILPHVSVTRSAIETCGAMLVQRQHPRALGRMTFGTKAMKSASGAAQSIRSRPQAPDPRAMQCRSSQGVIWRTEKTSMSRPAVEYRQLRGRATTAQRGRRSVRLKTQRMQDCLGTDQKSRAQAAPG